MNDNPANHSFRRIILPSGRSIEVVSFIDHEQPAPQGLHVCPRCGSELVQPLSWSEAGLNRWELALRCPNCDWMRAGVFDQEQIQQLEERLEAGVSQMLDDLRSLTQVNMSEGIERFSSALRADLILPEDF